MIEGGVNRKGFHPKRSLGQNFLTDTNVARWIVRKLGLSDRDQVIEIGPGKGILTHALLETGVTVTAIEKDEVLCSYLRKKFEDVHTLTLIQGDATRIPWPSLIDAHRPAVLTGNLPYNVSTRILWNLLDKTEYFKTWQFLFQKEVADRICAEKGTSAYGALSVFVQSVTRPTLMRIFPPKFFFPPPKVDSALVLFEILPFSTPSPMKNRTFIQIVKAAFTHRRKMLRNNLKSLFNGNKQALESFLDHAGIPGTLRAQELSVGDYLNLAEIYSKGFSS